MIDNQLDLMMAWENGTIDEEDEITLFQELVNSGMAWSLQGCYGRHAAGMIKAGIIENNS